MLVPIIICLFLLETAADTPYSNSSLLIKNINLYVNGIFREHNSAIVNVDFETNYGFPRGKQIKRSPTNVPLYRDGYQRFTLTDVQFILENPLSFIKATAYVEITWVFNYTTPDVMKNELFTIQDITFDNADDKYLNISLDRPDWYLALSYKKGCENVDYFGFKCNVFCPKPATAVECYTCNNVSGVKECCKDSAYDQDTCQIIDPDHNGRPLSPLKACQDQLAQTKDDYDYQNKWRKVFFWLFILFVVLALVLIGILFCCFFGVLHYKEKLENQQKVYPEEECRRTTIKSTRERPNSSNNNEIYRQPVQKRRSMSIASVESEFRMTYPLYQQSPGPRRRNEQLV